LLETLLAELEKRCEVEIECPLAANTLLYQVQV